MIKAIGEQKGLLIPSPQPLTYLAVCFDGRQEIFLAVKASNQSDARLKVEAQFVSNGSDPSKVTIKLHVIKPVKDIQIIGYHRLIVQWG